ncbi:MAG: RNA polymerase sigma factor SigY [Bacillota bacterium]
MDEAALISKAQRGDSVALARLLQMHYLSVKKYLVTVTFDRNLSEDLTQETMIRAIQRIGQFGGRSRFSTWLIAIATNLYMDWLRKQKRERRLEEDAIQSLLLRPADVDPEGEVRELLDRLHQLPRDVSLPLILKHYYGYTYEEIAGWMDLPVGTVKSRIFNAIRSLRKGDSDEQP